MKKPSFKRLSLLGYLFIVGGAFLAFQQIGQAQSLPHPDPNEKNKQGEHIKLFELVQDKDATHRAIQNGDWNNPATWDNGVPGQGAKVIIPKAITVTYASENDTITIAWIRVDGTMRFDPNVNTKLKVITWINNTTGYVEIGSANARIAADKKAHIILADRGVRDDAMRAYDPIDISGGFISHGKIAIYGAEYNAHAKPIAVLKKGDTSFSVPSAPKGWKTGDELLFPSLYGAKPEEDEKIKIASITDATVTLEQPLAYQHGGIRGYDEAPPVGNLTRNVVFESEKKDDLKRRGHFMQMHNHNAVVDSARFFELGRTDTLVTHTDPGATQDGAKTKKGDANTIGRYALHFHMRSGATYKITPFIARNNAIENAPKHGIVNHGGYGLVEGNVVFKAAGSSFFGENGSELGTFKNNMAIRTHGEGDRDSRAEFSCNFVRDAGYEGNGFWLEGGGIDVTDNFASGHTHTGYNFNTEATADDSHDGQICSVFLKENLRGKTIPQNITMDLVGELFPSDKPYILVNETPFYSARNVDIGSKVGIFFWAHHVNTQSHQYQSIVEDSRFINNNRFGTELIYSRQITFKNTEFIGPGNTGIGANEFSGDVHLEEVKIDGYTVAYTPPPSGVNIIKDSSISGSYKVLALPAWGGKLIIDNITWGPGTGHIQLAPPTDKERTGRFWKLWQPHEVIYNGQQVYYDSQKADAIPFTKTNSLFDGKTNQQLWDLYRLAIGGRVAPATLTPHPDIIGGAIGATVSFDPTIYPYPYLTEAHYIASKPANLSRDYMIDGKQYASVPINAVTGWNIVPINTENGVRNTVIYSTSTANKASISLAKYVTPTSLKEEVGTLTYRIHATNGGDKPATNVVVSDVLPPRTVYVGGSATPGDKATYDANLRKLTWNLGTLAPGTSQEMTFQVTLGQTP